MFSLPFVPIILRFVLLMFSHISWMFCVNNFFYLMFSLPDEFYLSTYLSTTPEILSSIFSILFVQFFQRLSESLGTVLGVLCVSGSQ